MGDWSEWNYGSWSKEKEKKESWGNQPPKRGKWEKEKTVPQGKAGSWGTEDAAHTLDAPKDAQSTFKSRTTTTTREFLTNDRFDSVKEISAETQRSLRDVMKYENMTAVQSATMRVILAGNDVLAKAKTGTGKTLGFLIPTVEKAYRNAEWTLNQREPLCSLAISPTRELAQQIAEECAVLTQFGNLTGRNGKRSAFNTLTIYGGTNIRADKTRLMGKRVDLLVATPGRLLDHLKTTPNFKEKMDCFWDADAKHSFTLMLDEADQLLEMGFRPDIERIIGFLPEERQTLLFSATIPQALKDVSHVALKKTYKFIDCVGDDEPTVAKVTQTKIITETYDLTETLFSLLLQIVAAAKKAGEEYKVILFFITARQTQFYAELATATLPGLVDPNAEDDTSGGPTVASMKGGSKGKKGGGKGKKGAGVEKTTQKGKKESVSVYEIHSRKSQAARNKASEAFRECTTGILFSSDVSARGLDYPDVSHVIQVGAPSNREQYLHRLGRTARAGTKGQGLLVLHPFESYFMSQLSDLKLADKSDAWEEVFGSKVSTPDLYETLAKGIKTKVDQKTREQCYSAWLGYYNGLKGKLKWSKEKLVEEANAYAEEVLLLAQPPALLKKTVGMMQLKGVKGLRVQ